MIHKHIERFNAAAYKYRTDRYPGRTLCMKTVLDFLDPQIDDIILDVGCGPGTQLIELSPIIRYGYGIDPAENMIRQAEQASVNCSNINFFVGSAEILPKSLNHVGINKVISNYALHHLSDRAKQHSIQRLFSILPSNGMIVLGDLMFSDDPDKYKELFDTVGYGPGCDTPSQLLVLEDMFNDTGVILETYILNPLVAVIIGKKI